MGFSIRRYVLAALSRRECAMTQSDWKWLRFTHAQPGEDIIAEALLPETRGPQVEVGAFHPVSISNTYVPYRRGWRGIVRFQQGFKPVITSKISRFFVPIQWDQTSCQK
jgi:hypothetical protein